MVSGLSDEAVMAVRLAIIVLSAVVFAGYMMIWVMKPTNVYFVDWQPHIQAKADSKFFGEQG